jgi:hypothetical protein
MNNNSKSIKYWRIKLIKKIQKVFNWKKWKMEFFLKKYLALLLSPTQQVNIETFRPDFLSSPNLNLPHKRDDSKWSS